MRTLRVPQHAGLNGARECPVAFEAGRADEPQDGTPPSARRVGFGRSTAGPRDVRPRHAALMRTCAAPMRSIRPCCGCGSRMNWATSADAAARRSPTACSRDRPRPGCAARAPRGGDGRPGALPTRCGPPDVSGPPCPGASPIRRSWPGMTRATSLRCSAPGKARTRCRWTGTPSCLPRARRRIAQRHTASVVPADRPGRSAGHLHGPLLQQTAPVGGGLLGATHARAWTTGLPQEHTALRALERRPSVFGLPGSGSGGDRAAQPRRRRADRRDSGHRAAAPERARRAGGGAPMSRCASASLSGAPARRAPGLTGDG